VPGETSDGSPWSITRLRELGCDYAQGFLLGRPLDARSAEKMLAVAA
jgi:EAL domain-containing protein (putative c-di-GMP-specific phosphodiesterase class I)